MRKENGCLFYASIDDRGKKPAEVIVGNGNSCTNGNEPCESISRYSQ